MLAKRAIHEGGELTGEPREVFTCQQSADRQVDGHLVL